MRKTPTSLVVVFVHGVLTVTSSLVKGMCGCGLGHSPADKEPLSGCLCTHAAVWVSVYSCCCLGSCVLMLLSGFLCTHAAVWVSVYSCCCLGVCVLMLLSGFLCTHAAVWVPVYSCCCLGVCVLMLLGTLLLHNTFTLDC